MIEYIKGEIAELSPTYAVVESGGIGYFLNISLYTYEKISSEKEVKLLVHQIIREDSHSLYGFFDKDERDIFRHLISVSGIGASTARLMLSSLKPDEIRAAILQSNVSLLKSIKGIGVKTAQRIIVDLKDKIDKSSKDAVIPVLSQNSQEAVEALVTLGFNKKTVEKVVNNIVKTNSSLTVEQIIKEAFKFLT